MGNISGSRCALRIASTKEQRHGSQNKQDLDRPSIQKQHLQRKGCVGRIAPHVDNECYGLVGDVMLVYSAISLYRGLFTVIH